MFGSEQRRYFLGVRDPRDGFTLLESLFTRLNDQKIAFNYVEIFKGREKRLHACNQSKLRQ